MLAGCTSNQDWRTASRQPAGIAAAPAWGWRGWFAVHTWIAAQRNADPLSTVYEVVGWRERRGLPVLRMEEDVPDRLLMRANLLRV